MNWELEEWRYHAAQFLSQANRCTETPSAERLREIYLRAWKECEAEIRLIKAKGSKEEQ